MDHEQELIALAAKSNAELQTNSGYSANYGYGAVALSTIAAAAYFYKRR